MGKSRRNMFLLLAGMLLLVTMVAVGCGEEGDTTTTQAQGDGETATTEATETTEAATSTPTPEGETINLTFAAYHPTGTAEAELIQDFIDQIEARTDGAVQIEFLSGGSLLGPADMYDGVVNQVTDIGESGLSYNMGKFPVTALSTAPLSVPSPWVMTHMLNDFYKEYEPAEFESTKVLWTWANGPAVLMTSSEAVETLDDLKGLKIRSKVLTAEIVRALGAAPASVGMGEMYDALSKGVVDGVMTDPSVLASFKLGDVIKYIVDCSNAVGNGFGFYIAMNNDAWNELPADIQSIFEQTANEMIEKSALAINQQDIDGLEYAKAAGAEIVPLSDAEEARWQAAVASVTDDYVAGLVDEGFSEDTLREYLNFMRDRIDYWTEQQIEQDIPFPLE